LRAKPLDYIEIDALPPSLPAAAVAAEQPQEQQQQQQQQQQHWLALDEVWDPQNFGALLRSAYFLGMKGVVVCAKNSAALSPTVSKASAGALEMMPVYAGMSLLPSLPPCLPPSLGVL